MYDDTPGATIFYTVVSGTGPCPTPMHDGSGNAIPPTKKIIINQWPTVPVGAVRSIKPLVTKLG